MQPKKILYLVPIIFMLAGCGDKDKEENNKNPEPNPPVIPEDPKPEALTPAKPLAEDFNYNSFAATPAPFGLNVSYYSDIYSRGFAYFTDDTVTDTKLYVVESGKNYEADFSKASEIQGTTLTCQYKNDGKGFEADDASYEKKSSNGGSTLIVKSHKVHIENLKPNTSYSYKVGSEEGWEYGAFTTDVASPKSFTAIQMSDAQTYHPEMLATYRTTVKEAVKVAGADLDFILYNGDQFDQNMKKVDGSTINTILRYAKVNDALKDYKSMIPFMNSSGNHEPSAPYSTVLGTDVKYGAYDYKGGNYSYNYGPAHIIVLNSNRLADDDPNDEDYVAQMAWLTQDLASDACKNAKWRIAMMHIACYSTGDHSNDSDNQRLVERLSPLFASNKFDLVLQAHDHTYNKTLPYKWDGAGYSTTYDNADVVNFSVQTEKIGDRTYDVNPNGTYYVTTGAAGHRAGSGGKDGAHEYEDGIWSEVVVDEDGKIQPAYDQKTYRTNKYKCEVGTLNCATKFTSYTTSKNVTVAADYKVGDPATVCVDGQMFGVLNVTEDKLTYDTYVIKTGTSESALFDTLSIYHKA